MITLLHGDNIEESRKEFVRIKNEAQGRELRDLTEFVSDENALRQGLESHSLFGSDLLVVFENALSHFGRKEKALDDFLSIVLSSPSVDILFWENKEIGKGTIAKLGSSKVKIFKLPVVLFAFLDAIAPNNVPTIIDLYRKTVAINDPYLVFTMTARRVHDLLCVMEGVSADPSQAWQLGRLTKQAKLFTIEKLLFMQRSLLSLDISNKSGLSALPLQASVELFLATL
ncbi:hypothetical protein HY947_03400 [Candidatus Gottesmanbacteria bacterium]|nr:hypothetical protein [Candidatus Gottesmanbacteria bacterium]